MTRPDGARAQSPQRLFVMNIPSRRSAGSNMEKLTTLGMGLVLVFFLATGLVAWRNVEVLRANNRQIIHTHEVIVAVDEVQSAAQNAETGQRGYLLTGDMQYLEPYQEATRDLSRRLEKLATLTRQSPTQQAQLEELRSHIDAKMSELDATLQTRRAEGVQAAISRMSSDLGLREMDAIRDQIVLIRQEEQRVRRLRLAEMDAAYRTALISGLLSGLLGAALSISVFVLVRRAARSRARQEWLHEGQVGLGGVMMGDQSLEMLADNILAYLGRYAGVQAAALFKGEGGVYRRVAAFGIPSDASVPQGFTQREGLLGQAASEGEILTLTDVPDGYLTIGSALGRDKPRHLIIAPARADGAVNAVMELGFLHAPDERLIALLDEIGPAIGTALRSA
ncbi:MAG TPA: CHASE3 domain-containing protein, partial [Brevundimonas sp.]